MPSAKQKSHRIPLNIRLGLLFLALPLSFETFKFFPGIMPVQEAWLIVITILLVLVYLPWRHRLGVKLQGFELYALVLMLLIPIWSALAAAGEFGQPLIFGLLAQRGMVLAAGVPLVLYMALKRGWVSLQDLETVALGMAWFVLLLFLVMNLTLNPSSFWDKYGAGFVTGPSADAEFAFDTVFLSFGFFYYSFRGIRERSLKDYGFAIIFFGFMLVVIHGRSLTVSLILSFIILTALWAPNWARIIKLIPNILAVLVLGCIVLYFFNKDLILMIQGKFSDAFLVVFKGELTEDASANARLEESVLALPYVARNLFFGNGLLSSQWNEGFKSVLGYFHPSDIGLIGATFIYGIFGTLFFSLQFPFALMFSRRVIRVKPENIGFIQAIKGMVLLIGLRSIANGQFVFSPTISLSMIAILWAASKRTS